MMFCLLNLVGNQTCGRLALQIRSANLMAQFWIGSTDVNFMLTQIGGWHIGCYNDQEARQAVEYAKERRWIGERIHYADAFPEGSLAYELTDAGLERVRAVYGDKGHAAAQKQRQWYRNRSHLRFPALTEPVA
jgi:hypothetical protein